MASGLIDIRGASKDYQTDAGAVPALRPTQLSFEPGEFVSIVGPSGCGKTTLLKMIGGLIPITGGEIQIGGERIECPREDLSFVFQSAVLLPWKTAQENVLLPINVRRRPARGDIERGKELLELVGLTKFRDRYPHELSGGMQQRVAICRALIQDPTCLLLDEPFGALDALTRETMNVFFNDLWLRTGKTVVMVTHSIQEAVFLSTRVVVMSKGPGEVIDDIQIELPRRRSPELIGDASFGHLTGRIRKYFANSNLS